MNNKKFDLACPWSWCHRYKYKFIYFSNPLYNIAFEIFVAELFVLWVAGDTEFICFFTSPTDFYSIHIHETRMKHSWYPPDALTPRSISFLHSNNMLLKLAPTKFCFPDPTRTSVWLYTKRTQTVYKSARAYNVGESTAPAAFICCGFCCCFRSSSPLWERTRHKQRQRTRRAETSFWFWNAICC